MQLRSVRFVLAIATALALCPLLAYADAPDANAQNSDESLIAAEVIQKVEDTAAALYTDALTLPDDLITNTTVMPAASILRGSDGIVYYLRETAVDDTQEHYAFKTLESFNTYLGTWETLAPLPQWLTYCSADMYNGNLVVCGVGYDASSFAPTDVEYVYQFNPEKGEWSAANATGVPLGASIVYDGKNLMVVGGGTDSLSAGTAAFAYFTDKGIGDQVGTLSTPVLNPQLAAHKEDVYVYSYGASPEDWASATPAAQHLQVIKDDISSSESPAQDLTSALPSFAPSDETGNIRAQVYGSLAAGIDGLTIVGPQMEDKGADTYVMAWDGSSFEPYSLRLSSNQLYGTGACVYANKLYAAGASIQEDNHAAFRATTVTAPAVVEGNNAIWQQGSSSLVVMTYNPDVSRFAKKVIVDGMLLTWGDEYAYTSGSTVVELASSYLENLHLGQHEMLTYFDGGGVVVTTYFTTEAKSDAAASSDPNPDGSSSRPMALAKTNDALLAVPFVILGIGAIGLGIYLVRRKSRVI